MDAGGKALTWRKVSPVTGFGCVLLVLAGGWTSQKSLLLDLDHLEGIAVAPLSVVLACWNNKQLFLFENFNETLSKKLFD